MGRTIHICRTNGSRESVPSDTHDLCLEAPASEYESLGRTLEKLPALTHLSLDGIDLISTNLDFLRGARRLRRLSIYAMSALHDCSALQYCPHLREIILGPFTAFDYDALSMCRQLRKLTIRDRQFHSFKALAAITGLRELSFPEGLGFCDFRPLAKMKQLVSLSVYHADFETVAGIESLGNLRCLVINFARLADATAIGRLRRLRILDLTGNTKLCDIAFLQGLHLESLRLLDIPKVTTLRPLKGMVTLREFLFGGIIDDGDVGPLVSLPALRYCLLARDYETQVAARKGSSGCEYVFGTRLV